MLHRTTDPASRSPLQGLLACLVAAAVCGWTGHYGMTLLAVACAALSARRVVWPHPSARRVTVLLAQAGPALRNATAALLPRRTLVPAGRRALALPVRAIHLPR